MQHIPSESDDIKAWKLRASSMALDERWFPVRKDTVELPSGKVIDDYLVWESPTIATVVPYTKDGLFVICEQYRHAVGKNMFQFPAGGVNKDETPEAAAVRELEEETGYKCGKLTSLGKSAAYPTKVTGYHHLFFAEDVTPTGQKMDDENELTRIYLITPEELVGLIDDGKFEVSDSLVAGLMVLRRLGL
jgi:ADP-ribose pyrophosphatase